MVLFECCCQCLRDVEGALEGGAGRIELCSDLSVGGVTPDEALIREALELCRGVVPLNALIRPRGGDFVFSDDEARTMEGQIRMCRELGANGVVIGALDKKGNVDIKLMKRLIAEADSMEVTFHRAFDECADPESALEDIISLGCKRLLSSGLAPSAYEGRDLLSKLVRLASGRIIIMPGAGINPGNAAAIAGAVQTTEYHGSAHGAAGFTDSATVKQIRTSLQNVTSG